MRKLHSYTFREVTERVVYVMSWCQSNEAVLNVKIPL